MPCSNTCGPFRPCGAPCCPYLPPRSWRGPNPQQRGNHHQEESHWYGPNVRMGVGYTSARDLNMTIHTDRVIRGQQSVHLGAGNYAARDLRAGVYGNVVDSTNDLSIGVGNVSGHDSELIVSENELRGRYGSVNIGVGNQSNGGIRIVVAGNRWRDTSPP